MRFNAGQRVFNDIRTFDLTTTKVEQSIIPENYIDRKTESIGALEIYSDKECEVTFVWKQDKYNKNKQYPKKISVNRAYMFDKINHIKDVIFKGEIGTKIDIEIGV